MKLTSDFCSPSHVSLAWAGKGIKQINYGKDYHGTDDDMPDAFDAWLSEIDQEDLIRIAGIAMRESELRGYDKASKFAIEVIKSQNK